MEDELFSTEQAVYQQHQADWLAQHAGAFVVIQDETVLPEFYGNFEDAVHAGARAFGVARNFMVREVRGNEPIYLFG